MNYESNIEGCLEDILMILKQKYDDFSDFSDSEDDMISKYTKTEYFKSKQKNLEKEVLLIKKESSLKHQRL